jgi:protein O-GlcNAc transferase
VTSKAKNTIDFVLAPPDRHTAAVNRLYAEFKGTSEPAEGSAQGMGAANAAAGSEQKKDVWESAVELIEKKDYTNAVPLLRQAAEEKPDEAERSYYLGRALLETDQLPEAEVALKKAKQLDPTKAGVSFNLALLYNKKGRKVQAVQALEEEKALSPDSAAVKSNLAGLYVETGQPDKAIEMYEESIASNPDDMDAYTNLANLYKEKGDKAKEEETYKRLGERDPSGKSLYNLGNLAFNRSEHDKAAVYYKQVLAKDPNHANAHLQLGYCLVSMGDLPGAIQHFEAFLKLSPKDSRAAEAKKTLDELKKIAPAGKG